VRFREEAYRRLPNDGPQIKTIRFNYGGLTLPLLLRREEHWSLITSFSVLIAVWMTGVIRQDRVAPCNGKIIMRSTAVEIEIGTWRIFAWTVMSVIARRNLSV